jgi:hypothetical protein
MHINFILSTSWVSILSTNINIITGVISGMYRFHLLLHRYTFHLSHYKRQIFIHCGFGDAVWVYDVWVLVPAVEDSRSLSLSFVFKLYLIIVIHRWFLLANLVFVYLYLLLSDFNRVHMLKLRHINTSKFSKPWLLSIHEWPSLDSLLIIDLYVAKCLRVETHKTLSPVVTR